MRKDKIEKIVGTVFLSVLISICIFVSFAVSAEKYPSRPISIVVGFPPGGSTDLPTRAYAKSMEKILNNPIVVINKPGAGSAVQMHFVKNSSPDGYTLGTLVSSPVLDAIVQERSFNIFEDFTHLHEFGEWIAGLVVHPDSPWKTLHEFVEDARKNPGKVKYAIGPEKSQLGMLAAQFGILNGIPWVPVRFSGDVVKATQVMGKHVDAAFVVATAWAPLVKAGRLRALAVFESKLKEFPNVPQASELGYKYAPNFRGFLSIIGPKGLPSDVKETLMNAARKACKDPEFQSTMDNILTPAVYKEGDEWLQFLKEYETDARSIMKKTGLLK